MLKVHAALRIKDFTLCELTEKLNLSLKIVRRVKEGPGAERWVVLAPAEGGGKAPLRALAGESGVAVISQGGEGVVLEAEAPAKVLEAISRFDPLPVSIQNGYVMCNLTTESEAALRALEGKLGELGVEVKLLLRESKILCG